MFHALRTRLSSRLLIPTVVALLGGSAVPFPAVADDAPVLPPAPAAAPTTSPRASTDQFIVKFKAHGGRQLCTSDRGLHQGC